MKYQKLKIVFGIVILVIVIRLLEPYFGLWKTFTSLDNKLIAAVIAVIAGIITVTLTHYWTKKREIEEIHRLRKSEIYRDFVQKVLVKSLQGVKQEQTQEEIAENLEDFIFSFVGALIVWGSPSVIHAYRQFQKSAEFAEKKPEMIFSSMDNLLQKIRQDLGHSNKGLKQYDLYNLFLKGSSDIAEEIQSLNEKK